MTQDRKDILRIGGAFLLLFLSALAFYQALFLGWASGASSENQPQLKTASNVALAVSFISFWTSVGIWLVPYLVRRMKKKRANGTGIGTQAAHR